VFLLSLTGITLLASKHTTGRRKGGLLFRIITVIKFRQVVRLYDREGRGNGGGGDKLRNSLSGVIAIALLKRDMAKMATMVQRR
jgi:hypothetical protein